MSLRNMKIQKGWPSIKSVLPRDQKVMRVLSWLADNRNDLNIQMEWPIIEKIGAM